MIWATIFDCVSYKVSGVAVMRSVCSFVRSWFHSLFSQNGHITYLNISLCSTDTSISMLIAQQMLSFSQQQTAVACGGKWQAMINNARCSMDVHAMNIKATIWNDKFSASYSNKYIVQKMGECIHHWIYVQNIFVHCHCQTKCISFDVALLSLFSCEKLRMWTYIR